MESGIIPYTPCCLIHLHLRDLLGCCLYLPLRLLSQGNGGLLAQEERNRSIQRELQASIYLRVVQSEYIGVLPRFLQKLLLAHCSSVLYLLFRWFMTLLVAEKLGIFKYWRVDIFNGPGDNSPEDSFV